MSKRNLAFDNIETKRVYFTNINIQLILMSK